MFGHPILGELGQSDSPSLGVDVGATQQIDFDRGQKLLSIAFAVEALRPLLTFVVSPHGPPASLFATPLVVVRLNGAHVNLASFRVSQWNLSATASCDLR